MKSTQASQFPGILCQHICMICQKTFTIQNNMCESRVSCSSRCTDKMFTCTTWAFTQGFVLSCILCLCEKVGTEAECGSEKFAHEGVSLMQSESLAGASAERKAQQRVIKNESLGVGSSALTVMDTDSMLSFTTKGEGTPMTESDLYDMDSPVLFGIDLLHEPSLDGHTNLECETGHVLQSEEKLAVSHTVSDTSSLSSLPYVSHLEQFDDNKSVSPGTSPRDGEDEVLLPKRVNSNGVDSQINGESIPLDSLERQHNFSTEHFSISNTAKPEEILNDPLKPNQTKPNCASLKTNIKTLKNKLRCVYCCKSFCTKRLLNQHIKSHMVGTKSLQECSQQNFACEYCAQVFMNKYSLKAHIKRKHSGEEPVKCDICGKPQPSSFALSAHKKACHDFNTLCHICGAEFSGRTSFDKHMAGHEGIKRYFCDICGAGFVHNSSLNNHSAVHVTTKSYQCDVCSQMFKTQHFLNEHLLKIHQCGPSLEHRIRGLRKMGVDVDKNRISRRANHLCIICSEPLMDGVCLSHQDTIQEVFHCPTCGDRTSNIVLFYQHVKWHKGMLLSHNRRTSVSGEAAVSHHLSTSESGSLVSVIKCEVCSKTFKNFEYLSAHMHQHREARFVCDICNKRFTYKCNLKTHMNTHLDTWQFECEACKKKFRDKYAFKKHQLKHTEPQFKCQVCGKALTRRPYLLKHYQKMHPEYQGSMLL